MSNYWNYGVAGRVELKSRLGSRIDISTSGLGLSNRRSNPILDIGGASNRSSLLCLQTCSRMLERGHQLLET